MPAITFGLGSNKKGTSSTSQSLKRKAAFDIGPEDHDAEVQHNASSPFAQQPAVKKRPSPSHVPGFKSESANLSALRNAKLQSDAAAQLDSTVYDYDQVYESFAPKAKQEQDGAADVTVPRYMSNLLASAETRKRDQLRAKEKQLQRERELEGDEFADKEQFVTGAYKKQQEENRRLEEQERIREEQEEQRRRQGGGMMAFHKTVLAKDDQRLKAVEAAQEAAREAADAGQAASVGDVEPEESQIAAELNQKGANIVTNDDGEIIDKRQLLTAGLNVVPKKAADQPPRHKQLQEQYRPNKNSNQAQDARISQRERQSRMIERQIEEMENRQKEAELAERQSEEARNKSKLTDNDKLSAKERYLQRKREREEEAKAKAAAK